LQERQLAAQYLAKYGKITHTGPWGGYAPDLPYDVSSSAKNPYAYNCHGLVPKLDPQFAGGEVLTNPDGWSLPDISNNSLSGHADIDAASTGIIVATGMFDLLSTSGYRSGEATFTPFALISGDNSTEGSFQFFRLKSDDTWDEVNHAAKGGLDYLLPKAGRDGDQTDDSNRSLPDWCVFSGGAPGRTATNEISGNIAQPVLLWTNNVDDVMVYPSATGAFTFESITADTNLCTIRTNTFTCISLESFGDRVYYFNTQENAVRYPQRLRRTMRGTADPDTSNPGSGYIDIDRITGAGLRVEALGDVLACYFENGVAFVRETGIATAPNEVQVLDTDRGIIGTHAMCSVGDNRHFVIAHDGWWFLDSNGRWAQAGLDDNGSRKWLDTFYRTIRPGDPAAADSPVTTYKHRTYCHYDRNHNWIVISFQSKNSPKTDGPEEVWIYDYKNNRVWPDSYEGGATCWGEVATVIQPDVIWQNATAEFWDTTTYIWSDFGAVFGERGKLAHGNNLGNVCMHNPERLKRQMSADSDLTPSWSYESVPQSFGNVNTLKISDYISLEVIDQGVAGSWEVFSTDLSDNTEGGGVNINPTGDSTQEGRLKHIRRHMRHSATHLGYKVAGTGAVAIRSISQRVIETDEEIR
jgi:hypothetical protein